MAGVLCPWRDGGCDAALRRNVNRHFNFNFNFNFNFQVKGL